MKKRAFTLIELLAVIVILAVIALIATPIVLNVIDNAQRQADLNSVNGLIDAGRLYYSESLLNEEKQDKVKKYQNLWNDVAIMGEKPQEGFLYVNPEGNVALSVIYRNICYQKEFETGLEILKESDCGLGVVGNDKKAPEVEFIVLDSPFNEFEWSKEDFYVKIQIKDDQSGVKSYQWCRTVGTECEPKSEQLGDTGTVIIDTESTSNRLCVIGIDNQRNQSEVKCSEPYMLDKTSPSLSGIGDIIIGKDESVDVEIGVSASDSLSGIKGRFAYTPTSVDTSKSGITEVTYQIEDKAGNRQEYIRKVIVETGSPTVTYTAEEGKINSNGWAKDDFFVTITPNDQSGHGMKEFKWCSTTGSSCDPSGNAPQTTEKGAVTISTESASNRICVIATDNTGITSTNICSDVYKLDKTAPLIGISSINVPINGSVDLTSGVSATDALSGIIGSFSYNPTTVSTGSIGTTNVTYQAVDLAGNVKTVIRNITVYGYNWQKYNAVANYTYYWNRYNIAKIEQWQKETSQWLSDTKLGTALGTFCQSYTEDSVLHVFYGKDCIEVNHFEMINQWQRYPYVAGPNEGVGSVILGTYRNFRLSVDDRVVMFEYVGTEYKKVLIDGRGNYVDQVNSSTSNTYPNNGSNGAYWFLYVKSDITSYVKGTTDYGVVIDGTFDTYPTNGRHSDGYWYVKIG